MTIMTQVVAIDTGTVKNILSTLRELKEQLVRLNERLEGEPPYGSDAWWQWSDKKAKEDIKAGRYTKIRGKKELHLFLDSLKTAS